jgi:pyridoxal phosphate enzyme (YggS family)
MTARDALAANLAAVEARLAAACARAGRDRRAVTLVAVTKSAPDEVAALLPGLGALDLAENRPQELWRRAALLGPPVRWHFVGHLQRNKVERTVPLVTLLHSVDSLRLLEALEAEAGRQGRALSALIEVNCSGEASKGGLAPEEARALVGALRELRHIRVRGLMTMAAPADDPEEARPAFRLLRATRDALRAEVGAAHDLAELSMGMSGDFEVAVEEGATLVRLGTVLFEGVGGHDRSD